MAENKDGHEYRFAYALFAIAGVFNGIVDALIDDFTAKFFITKAIDLFIFMWVAYEMLLMDKPRRPFLASFLLILLGMAGYIGFWHGAWAFSWVLYRGPLPDPLWLAPNVYAPLLLYNIITFALALAYMIYGVLINISDKIKSIYSPNR